MLRCRRLSFDFSQVKTALWKVTKGKLSFFLFRIVYEYQFCFLPTVPDNTLSTLEQKTVASGNTVSFPCDLGDYSVPRAVAVWERQISQGGLDSTQILWPGSHDTDRRIRVTNGDGEYSLFDSE